MLGWDRVFLAMLESFPGPREAKVIVQRSESEAYIIADHAFLGTVLGPPLWNSVFADVDAAILAHDFRPTEFADHLLAEKQFDLHAPREQVHAQMSACQGSVHAWGVRNSVLFDAGKESLENQTACSRVSSDCGCVRGGFGEAVAIANRPAGTDSGTAAGLF